MLAAVALPLLFALAPEKPAAQVPVRGAMIDRASQPVHLIAEGKGGARILLDDTTAPGLKEAAMTELLMLPGAGVAEHTHDTSAELLYIVEGHATMTLDGQTSMIRAGMAVFIPAGVKHSMKVDARIEPLRAIQIYTPGGPEQRFTKGEISKE
jgi:mannose-6-phosphate isomerase-like protein (cupin superfamily)